jgi:hypothetical protein
VRQVGFTLLPPTELCAEMLLQNTQRLLSCAALALVRYDDDGCPPGPGRPGEGDDDDDDTRPVRGAALLCLLSLVLRVLCRPRRAAIPSGKPVPRSHTPKGPQQKETRSQAVTDSSLPLPSHHAAPLSPRRLGKGGRLAGYSSDTIDRVCATNDCIWKYVPNGRDDGITW